MMIDQTIQMLENALVPLRQVYAQPPQVFIPDSVAQFVEASDVGITDAVRGAYRLNADRRLTATQVRNIVASHGFDLSKYDNAMANIHQVISRLKENKEIDGPFQQGNEKSYQWANKPGLKEMASTERPLKRRYGTLGPNAEEIANNLLEKKNEK